MTALVTVLMKAILAGLAAGQSIMMPPTDATGILGESVKFTCQVHFWPIRAMTWEFNGRILYSYQGGIGHYPNDDTHKYSVKKDGKLFVLTLKNLAFADSGKYTCTAFIAQSTAVLVVIGEQSIHGPAFIPEEGETVTYTCEGHFAGISNNEIKSGQYPQLQMYIGNDPQEEISSVTVSMGLTNYHRKKYNVSAASEMDNKKITCKILTLHPMVNASVSAIMRVLYSVRNVSYSPHQEIHKVGSALTCQADGYPSPSYEWTESDVANPGNPRKGSILLITEDMIPHNSWKCIARNVIKNKMYEGSVIAIFDAVANPESTAKPVEKSSGIPLYAVSLLSILGTTFVIGIFLYLFFGRKFSRYKQNSKDSLQYRKSDLETKTGGNYAPLLESQSYDETLGIKSSEFTRTIQNLQTKEDLDSQKTNILKRIEKNGNIILKDPKIFLAMVKKAASFIESHHYIEIMQKMSALCEGAIHFTQEGPLQCILQIMAKENKYLHLINNQENFLKLLQALVSVDDFPHSRSKFMMALLAHSQYISKAKYTVRWTVGPKDLSIPLNCCLKMEQIPPG